MYSGGGGGSVLASDNGTANYNGLISTLQHRLSSSFSLLVNETWSKCLNEEDAQGDLAGTTVENPYNPAMDYGPCGSDYRHVFNTALVAKSPFSFGNALEKALINNWEFVPGIHVTSGAPFSVTAGVDNSLTSVNNDRPNLVPGVPIYLSTKIQHDATETARGYLNPAAFCSTATQPVPTGCPLVVATGTYGNIGRNSFRGKPQFNMDAQISRIFPIHEEFLHDRALGRVQRAEPSELLQPNCIYLVGQHVRADRWNNQQCPRFPGLGEVQLLTRQAVAGQTQCPAFGYPRAGQVLCAVLSRRRQRNRFLRLAPE